MTRPTIRILPTLLVLLAGAAFAQGGTPTTEAGGAMEPGRAMTPAIVNELEFLQRMIPHHQEAVDRARQLAAITEREAVRDLTDDMARTRSAEIVLMRSFLTRWHLDAATEATYEPAMRDLDGLAPDDADRVFLEDMIEHHHEAIRDGQRLVRRGLARHPEVEELARVIAREQARELATMQGWLRAWFGDMGMDAGMTSNGDGGADDGRAPGVLQGAHEMIRNARQHLRDMMPDMTGWGPEPVDATADLAELHLVEALAQAYALGYGRGATVESIEPPERLYRVTITSGDEVIVLTIDARTGAITPVDAD